MIKRALHEIVARNFLNSVSRTNRMIQARTYNRLKIMIMFNSIILDSASNLNG
jgi:hypothetical protein